MHQEGEFVYQRLFLLVFLFLLGLVLYGASLNMQLSIDRPHYLSLTCSPFLYLSASPLSSSQVYVTHSRFPPPQYCENARAFRIAFSVPIHAANPCIRAVVGTVLAVAGSSKFQGRRDENEGSGCESNIIGRWQTKEVAFLWLPIPFRPKGKKCSIGTRDARQGLLLISRFLLPTDYFRVHCALQFRFSIFEVAFLIHSLIYCYSVSCFDFELISHCRHLSRGR
jgi:hypothetical protein